MRYVIVDLEATCWMGRPVPERMEVIEIGAVLLASKRGPIQKEFSSLVRPIKRPTLSAFCMGLTGIQQHEIDEAEDFSKVFPRFLKWIGRNLIGCVHGACLISVSSRLIAPVMASLCRTGSRIISTSSANSRGLTASIRAGRDAPWLCANCRLKEGRIGR